MIRDTAGRDGLDDVVCSVGPDRGQMIGAIEIRRHCQWGWCPPCLVCNQCKSRYYPTFSSDGKSLVHVKLSIFENICPAYQYETADPNLHEGYTRSKPLPKRGKGKPELPLPFLIGEDPISHDELAHEIVMLQSAFNEFINYLKVRDAGEP